jgi:hypothetical protein
MSNFPFLGNLPGAKEMLWLYGAIFQFRALGLIDANIGEFNEEGLENYRKIDDERQNLNEPMLYHLIANCEHMGLHFINEEHKAMLKVVVASWKDDREEFLKSAYSHLLEK